MNIKHYNKSISQNNILFNNNTNIFMILIINYNKHLPSITTCIT